MNSKAILAIAALGGALSACTTLGTNVSGSFRCDAPDGVCAPSTVIDDNAISRIEETSSTDLLNPAGPYQMDDGIDAPVHSTVLASAPMTATSAPSYELAVVFPGYTDATGMIHARRTVRTEAVLPGRGDAMEAMAMRGRHPTRNQGLLAAAESAPPFLAITPDILPPAADPTAKPQEVAVATGTDPIAAIEAQVSKRLAGQQAKPRRQAASFPGVVE